MQFHAHRNQQSFLAKLEGTESLATHPMRTHMRTETSAAPSPVLRNYSSTVHLQQEQDCADRATLPYKDQPHIGGKQGKRRWASPTMQLLPSEKTWGGLAAPRAAGLRTGGQWPRLGEFSNPWANGSLNQAKQMLSLLKISTEATGTLFRGHCTPAQSKGRTRVLLAHPSTLRCSHQL